MTIDPVTGEVTGTGAALALYNAEAEAQLAFEAALGDAHPISGDALRDDIDTYLVGYAAHFAAYYAPLSATVAAAWAEGGAQHAAARARLLAKRIETAAAANARAVAIVAIVALGEVTVEVPSVPRPERLATTTRNASALAWWWRW